MNFTLNLEKAILKYNITKDENDMFDGTLYVSHISDPFKISHIDLRHLIIALGVRTDYTSDTFMDTLSEFIYTNKGLVITSHHGVPLFSISIDEQVLKTTDINQLFEMSLKDVTQETIL